MTTPIKSSNNKTRNCTPISSSCVVWQGDLPSCIEVCWGDTIEDILFKVATDVCILKTNSNLLVGDLGCLPISSLDGDYSIKNVVKQIISEHCSLEERVTTLENTPTTTSTGEPNRLTVNGTYLNCVETFTGNFLPNPATDNQIVNLILQGLCQVNTELTSEISRLESLINNIPTTGTGTSTSVSVTSNCLFTGSKTIGNAWTVLDTAYCSFTTKFGTVAEVNDVFTEEALWLSDINTQLLTPLALDNITGSTTAAQTIENLWHVVGALNDKLASTALALSACCGFSCKKFEVTVNAINFDSDQKTIDLRFGFDGSSNLPGAPYEFIDTGSSVIFTDSTGFALASIPIDITDNTTYTSIDITGVELTGEIQVDVDVQFQVLDSTDPINVREFNCTKCLHTYFKTGSACAFCTLNVTISGNDPLVKIIYTVDGNTQTLLITEETPIDASYKSYILPSGATINSIINVNNSVVSITSSDCPNLTIPSIDTLACYSFLIDEDFFNLTADDYFYDITGFMVNGEDIVTYSPGIRADLTNARYTEDYSETEETCSTGGYVYHAYNSDATFGASVNSLRDIQPNDYVMAISRVCGNAYLNGSTPTLKYNNLIVRAIAGKNIFLKLTARDNNLVGVFLGDNTNVYIKGNEIPQGNDCDCCYVKTGN